MLHINHVKQKLYMKNLFTEGAVVLLPLQINEDLNIKPQPNFLAIKNIFDLNTVDFPTLSGERVPTKCLNSLMELQYREVLEDEKLSITVFSTFNQRISLALLGFLESEQSLIDNANIVNMFLPMIQFEGFLKDFDCRLDVNALQQYLDSLEEENIEEENIEDVE